MLNQKSAIPFTNAQLELLKVCSHTLSDSDLMELKVMLSRFFAEKLLNEVDVVWEENQWTDSFMNELLAKEL